ncbi:DUF1343 domain-containing protein [Flammeovirga yaeyamensis]|uniref:DUF1343 domain-containing protein n=1 Tax=Flammeovirga yaeyamensis TaxID=367791 RepID=A0AAX1N8C1_9BACT|nr:DUF1343 domain-containing protein [Flammeovirga yaeyamensis]MBB3698836.1 uncharacterized protein YbbC (DUF1343 family) [Flammeovirga yaeyamensis]NMF37421.1 DUF1343 domain-containing protein [Flammeovirga yaeyamensis]QWG03766.1 DUF1343 domain-containing protein [Flammeovirga yaeyamensis]
MRQLFIYLLVSILFSCQASDEKKEVIQKPKEIIVGAEQTETYLPLLKDKKVGLLVNQTSQIQGRHIVDSLYALGVNIEMIFAPEHGFRGDEDAGAHVKDAVDPKTGVKIYSIYGKNKRPSPELLKQVDIVLFDIQDVGCRFYTYISSMHYMMEACQEANIPMLVLDRPNPNGMYIDGPVLKEEFSSFVGMHPIPILHGLTVGELAKMINGEKWLRSEEECDLTVVPVKNYDHSMAYSLPVKPSPNLPNDQSILMYPSLCFFEATPVSIGRGTDFPFQVIGYNNKEMGEFTFTPRSIEGAASNPVLKGEQCFGEDLRKVAEGGLDLSYIIKWNEQFKKETNESVISKKKWMDLLSGTDQLRKQIEEGKSEKKIKISWKSDLDNYKSMRNKYLIYTNSK